DTTDQATYGIGDSNGFPLDTGGDDGTIKSGSGISPSPGFRLDTRSNPASVDFNQSGMGEFGTFTLDTGGSPSSYENNQSDFNDSGGFELDTNDPILSGFSDSPGFPLDTGGENGEIKTDSGDSAGFPLDTRDSGSNGNLAQFDFNDSNGFPLDTGGSSGSAPNQAPAFQSDGNLSIAENQTFVFDFNATDPDGDTLTYSLPYGDDHLLFDVNASTGILTFLTPKDFESPEDNDSNNRYEATIQVSDGNTSVSLNLFVHVTDVVESTPNQAPAFQSDGNLSIPENQSFVFDFNATDPDGDTLTYSLAYGDDAHLFEIIPSSGLLAFKSPPDFESPEDNNSNNRYEATIQVSDGNTSVTLNVQVQVIDLADDSGTTNSPPALHAFLEPLLIAENVAIGTVIGHLHASDPDPNDTLTFSLSPDAPHSLFEVASNGLIRTASSVDFEKNASHLLFLRVTDSFGAFADGNVTVEVIDLFRPVAETGMAESITETSAYLQGFVLDDGGLPVIERGFLISTRPSLEAGSEAVLRLIVDQNASDFSSTANGLQPGKKYFYRAYASNEEGISLGSKET
ncbi:MAG: cadherin domain-containing protein, partial [Opitutae bacterium]